MLTTELVVTLKLRLTVIALHSFYVWLVRVRSPHHPVVPTQDSECKKSELNCGHRV